MPDPVRWPVCSRCKTSRPPERVTEVKGEGTVCVAEDGAWCSKTAGVGKGEMPKDLKGEAPRTPP